LFETTQKTKKMALKTNELGYEVFRGQALKKKLINDNFH
jgi:hypothetical protein